MTTTSKSKVIRVTGDQTKGNGSSPFQPTAGNSVLIAGGGMGMESADSTSKVKAEKPCRKGCPVDVYGGDVFDSAQEFAFPGLVTLRLKRVYSSAFADTESLLGKGGWTFNLAQYLEFVGQGTFLRGDDGYLTALPVLQENVDYFHRAKRWQIRRDREAVRVYSLDSHLTREFGPVHTSEPKAGGGEGERWWLKQISDRRGNALRFEYDGLARLVQIVDPSQRVVVFSYNAHNYVQRVDVIAEGKSQLHLTYEYTKEGELGVVKNILGHASRFEYDGFHRMVKFTMRNGLSFHHRFDPDTGQCTRTWGDGGLLDYEFKRERQPDGSMHVAVTTANDPVYHVFNARGDLVEERSFDGRWARYAEFDEDHHELTTSNAAGHKYTHVYDDRANVVSTIDPTGKERRWEYAEDLPVRIRGRDGRSTRLTYDAFGDVVEVEAPDGKHTSFEYDRFGRLILHRGPGDDLHRLVFDDRHRLVEESDAVGASWKYEYDALGRPFRRTDPLGRSAIVERDPLGRAVRITTPQTTVELEYNAMSNVTRVSDSSGAVTLMEYWGIGSLSRQVLPDGSEWRFEYDQRQRIRKVVNSQKEVHEFLYEPGSGHVSEERTFDGRRIQYRYDLASKVSSIVYNDGSWRSFSYDPMGRLLEEDSPHGTQTFERDELGRLVRAVLDEGPQVVVEYDRDQAGRIIAERQGEHELRFEYDDAGRLARRTVPGCGTTDYGYDARWTLSRVAHMTPGGRSYVLAFERDKVGREVHRYTDSGKVHVHSDYDDGDRLVERRVSTPGLHGQAAFEELCKRTWSYDASGRIARTEDSRWGLTAYHYDKLGRLLEARRGQYHETFEYEPNGALQKALEALAPEHSFHGTDAWSTGEGSLLLSTGRCRYEYDDNHRRTAMVEITTGRRTEYIWDCRDRLREVRLPDGRRARYFYDAFGRRVRKEISATIEVDSLASALREEEGDQAAQVLGRVAPSVTTFLWDGNEIAAELDDERGNRGHVHHPGTLVPLLQIQGEHIYCVIYDHIGVPTELISEDGKVAWSGSLSPWGTLVDEYVAPAQGPPEGSQPGKTWSLRSPFRLRGQYFDEETGLCSTRFRYFEASTGRWLSPDPFLLRGGANPFAFDGSPTRDGDPLGLQICDEQAERLAKKIADARKKGEKVDLDELCPGLTPGEKAQVKEKLGGYDYDEGQGLYVLRDEDGNVRYVGIGDVPARGSSHQNNDEEILALNPRTGEIESVSKSEFTQEEIWGNGSLTKAQARGLEQRLIDHHGGAQSNASREADDPNTSLVNKSNSYTENNGRAQEYSDAGNDDDLWNQTLDRIGD